MPWTSLCFVIGSVAICGLPPLNGFVSEFLVYVGLFRALAVGAESTFGGLAFAAPALALIGALAVACFVKVYGTVFLGTPRSAHAHHAHEAPMSMLGPMGMLVACCFLIGLAPLITAPVLGKAISAWAPNLKEPGSRLVALAPLGSITTMGLLLVTAAALASAVLWSRIVRAPSSSGATWGCGYLAPGPRMQYTSSSFAQMLVGMFAWVLRPRIHRPKPLPLFPDRAQFHSDVPDAVLDEVLLPSFRFGAWLFSGFRVFQQGNIQAYLLYIFIVLVALLLWHR